MLPTLYSFNYIVYCTAGTLDDLARPAPAVLSGPYAAAVLLTSHALLPMQGKVTDYFRASKPTSCRSKSAAGKAGKGKAAGIKRKTAEATQPQQGSAGEEDDAMTAIDTCLSQEDAPLLSSQDTKLSRCVRLQGLQILLLPPAVLPQRNACCAATGKTHPSNA